MILSKAQERYRANRHRQKEHNYGDRGQRPCSCDMCRSQYTELGNRKHKAQAQVIEVEAEECGVRVRLRNPFHHRWYK